MTLHTGNYLIAYVIGKSKMSESETDVQCKSNDVCQSTYFFFLFIVLVLGISTDLDY